MPAPPNQSRPNALRDLIISVIWIVVSLVFLNVDRSRIASFHAAGSHVPVMRWLQVPIWAGMLVFWVRNGWKSWQHFRANDSGSR
jgi:hypothetical protein